MRGPPGVEGPGAHDLAVGGDSDEEGVPGGGQVRPGRVDDVAVPAGDVAGAEIPVDGVEHDGSGGRHVGGGGGPDGVVGGAHLHIICSKGSALFTPCLVALLMPRTLMRAGAVGSAARMPSR